MSNIWTKRCTKCTLIKVIDEFHRESKNKDGRRSNCKECVVKQSKARYAKNPDKYRKVQRDFRRDNLEKTLIRERANAERYAKKYPDRIKAKSRAYYKANKYRIKEYNYEWRKNYPDSYIKMILSQHSLLEPDDFPKSVIDAKRQQLKTKHFLQGKYQ